MTMTQARMAALLAAYGADPARWPAAERADAVAWMTAHGSAVSAARDAALALDAALAWDGSDVAPSEVLVARVLQSAPRVGDAVVAFHARTPRWSTGAVAALAACAVMGVVIGFNVISNADDATADADAAFGAAFGVSGLPGSDG